MDRFPFPFLGGVNRREDQVIVIIQRHIGLIACRFRRVRCQIGQEDLGRSVARGNLFELNKVGAARVSILMDPFQMRFIPDLREVQRSGPPSSQMWRDSRWRSGAGCL